MNRLERTTSNPFNWGQKLKAQELNDVVAVINNIIDYINLNEPYWLKDEAGESGGIVPIYNDENGEKIARISDKNGNVTYLLAPKQRNDSQYYGDKIRITSVQFNQDNGTLIAEFIINNETIKIYAPRQQNVTVDDIIIINPIYNSQNGTEIAEILNKSGQKINSIYAPNISINPSQFSEETVTVANFNINGSAGQIEVPKGIVEFIPTLEEGVPIATFKFSGGQEKTLYISSLNINTTDNTKSSTNIKVYNEYDSNTGIKVADIEVDGKLFPIYAPIQQSGSSTTPTYYSYIIEYKEEKVFTKYLVIQGHSGQNGQDISREKVISSSSYKPEEQMGKALQDYQIGQSITFNEIFQERTTDNNFTINGTPKYIRCGTNLQHNNGWYLTNTGDNDTTPGHGKGSLDELQRYDYPKTGRLGWNSGLDINQDNIEFGVNSEGLANNPPTKFEVYANINYDNNGGIYKFGEYTSNMDGLEYNVAENIKGLWIINAIKGIFTPTIVTNNGTETPTYNNMINVLVANDNTLMAGYTVLRSGETITVDGVQETISQSTWNNFKANPEKYIFTNGQNGVIDYDKWYRLYLSDPEFYPSNTSFSRGYKKAFSRWPQTGFFDKIDKDTEVTYTNSTMAYQNITLRKNDIFIYFKKNESIVSTNVYLSALVGINGVHIPSSSYGIPGEKWQLANQGAVLMYALDNDDWISYYDTAFDIPGTDPVGGKWIWENGKPKKDNNGNYVPNPHYHPTEYHFNYEEWVNKPDGTKYKRFGGDGYQIFAFRVNKDILNFNQLVL